MKEKRYDPLKDIDLDAIREKAEKLVKYKSLVKICEDAGGHVDPNEKNNLCNSCYLTLNLPENGAEKQNRYELGEIGKLPLMHQPMDAANRLRKLKEAKGMQESLDYFDGFKRYLESLK